jgi:hypothetical protein
VLVLARSVADAAAGSGTHRDQVTQLRRLAALPAGPTVEACDGGS